MSTQDSPPKIYQFIRKEFEPVVSDLLDAADNPSVDPYNAYVKFLQKAAEGAELFDSTALDEDTDPGAPVHRAREALFSAAALAGDGDSVQYHKTLTEDTRLLVDAVNDLSGVGDIEKPADVEIHPEDSKWITKAPAPIASVELEPFIHNDFDDMGLESHVQFHRSDPNKLTFGFEVTGECEGRKVRFGSITEFTPAQAENIARAFLECAEQARLEAEKEK